MDSTVDIGNRNHDDDGRLDIGNGNQGRDASFNVRDRIQICRDAIHGVEDKVVELSPVFQSLGTEGIFESVCIYTTLYPIHVNCFQDISCIPKYVL